MALFEQHGTIKKTYKKSDLNLKKKIDREANKLSKKLYLDKKMDCYSDSQSFITLKDLKDNFKSNTKCILINATKSQIGKVSQKDLEETISNAKKKYLNRTSGKIPLL